MEKIIGQYIIDKSLKKCVAKSWKLYHWLFYCNIVKSVTITFINSFDAITFVQSVLNLCLKRYWCIESNTGVELKNVPGSYGKNRTIDGGKIWRPNCIKSVLNLL